jgi:Lar family restriction alleviation protein
MEGVMGNKTLNPCPFCGGKFPSMAVDKNSVDVICIQCGVMMPSCNDEADAIGRWNERAPVASNEIPDDGVLLELMRDAYIGERESGFLPARKAMLDVLRPYLGAPTREPQQSETSDNSQLLLGFWKQEYKNLARAGVERLAECGIEVDPADRITEAAEYRASKLTDYERIGMIKHAKTESGAQWAGDAPLLRIVNTAREYVRERNEQNFEFLAEAVKSYNPDDRREPEQINDPYGYCPICGARGVMREKCLDGNDRCEKGHYYKSSSAKPPKHHEPFIRFFNSTKIEDGSAND